MSETASRLGERASPPGRAEVLRALDGCYDPCCEEREISVVDMGLIEEVEVRGSAVEIKMVLTSGWCPFTARMFESIKSEVGALPGVEEVDVEVVWDPAWTPERMSEGAKEKLTLPLHDLIPLREARLGKEKRP